MSPETPQGFRMALDQRLRNHSSATGVSVDRLRRRVLFERIAARLQSAEPGRWVLKGGMALEVRLGDRARLTKDIDMGLRDEVHTATDLHERLTDVLVVNVDDDRFVLVADIPEPLREDGGGHIGWRTRISAELAGKLFGRIQLDVSPRAHELAATEFVTVPSMLDFVRVAGPTVEVVDVHRHAAEKFHAMVRDFGERENSRVRDLVDIVIMLEHNLLGPRAAAVAATQVWMERDGVAPPTDLPPLPDSWIRRYAQIVAEHRHLNTTTFSAANALVGRMWTEMFPIEET